MSDTANPASTLPAPSFLPDTDGLDPNLVLADMIAEFEQASGRKLYPAQVERLLINLYAYRETLVRNAIQYAGQQNLLAFANYPMIDYLGQLVGVARAGAVAAVCPIQFTLLNALTVDLTIPAGTEVGTSDGNFIFATSSDLLIPKSAVVAATRATCTTPGSGANGYLAGQVSVLMGANALVASAVNTTATAGGSEIESDDHLRMRIQAAPNQFSTAGPAGGYRFWTIGADPSVVDALVTSPSPGTIDVYVLTGPITEQPAAGPNPVGIASPGVLNAVSTALSAATVRPLCDTVRVFPVTEVDYTVSATITLFANADPASTMAAANAAAVALAIEVGSQIQRDIVPSQWIAALSVFGVYEVTLVLSATAGGSAVNPTADGRFVLQAGQWANCVGITLTPVVGVESETS